MITRRSFVGASAALTAAGMLPSRRARAASVSGSDLKFVFVVNYGGWDPTRVFAPEFSNPAFDMERLADSGSVGDITFVDSADRPSVRSFLESWYTRTLFINGVMVPSIAHDNCLRLSMTGTTATTRSDWPSVIASARSESFSLPQLVIAGPSFPGDLGAMVTRTGSSGQLEGLLSGDILDWSDTVVDRPSSQAEDIMSRYLSRRAAAVAGQATSERELAQMGAFSRAVDRGQELKNLLNVIEWSGGSAFSSQASMAVDALTMGISRCVTISTGYSWDTHTQNDTYQSSNFESLFAGLVSLMEGLRTSPGEVSESLADETVVVVLSEMGRTPQLNSADGKDHWPYTCTMVVGPNIVGNRVYGAFDYYGYGKTLDFETGDVDEDAGRNIAVDSVGATLLQLEGVDSEETMPGVKAISALLG